MENGVSRGRYEWRALLISRSCPAGRWRENTGNLLEADRGGSDGLT